MLFYDFIEKQAYRDDPVGDVAKEVIADGDFPKAIESRSEIREYFRNVRHVEGQLDTVYFPLVEALLEWRFSLPVEHPEHPYGFCFDDENKTLDFWWSGHEYFVPLVEIDTPSKLVRWLLHLGEKNWEGQTPERVSDLIKLLNQRFEWEIYKH